MTKGKAPAGTKADVTITMDDETFVDLASGKVCSSFEFGPHTCGAHAHRSSVQLNGQKAFMSGKLKTRGNIMLATKLDGVLKVRCTLVHTCNVEPAGPS